MFNFLRKWHARRKRMHYQDRAVETKKIMSLIYALCAWHLAGYVMYVTIKDQLPADATSGEKFLRAAFGYKEIQRVRIIGFSEVQSFTSTNNDSESLPKEKEP